MSSKDKAIAISRGRRLAERARRCCVLAASLLLTISGLVVPVRGQVLEVPSEPAETARPSAPAFTAFASDVPSGSTFQAELERRQWGQNPPVNFAPNSVPGLCPECGQPPPEAAPHPWRPGERLDGALQRFFDPPVRFRGPGQPLLRESWLYRPFSAGWFLGAMQGGTLVDDWVSQGQGFLGGYRLGWDFHHYWGCEMRLAFGHAEIIDSQRAKDAQKQADDQLGLAPDDPFRQRFDKRRDGDLPIVWDFAFLWYPWGDSAWRPYLLFGLGYAQIKFEDRLSQCWESNALSLPLGVGLKYRWNDWLVLRVEFIDTFLVPGNDINAVQEFSLNGGVEIRFGGSRKAYWPWNPGLHYW